VAAKVGLNAGDFEQILFDKPITDCDISHVPDLTFQFGSKADSSFVNWNMKSGGNRFMFLFTAGVKIEIHGEETFDQKKPGDKSRCAWDLVRRGLHKEDRCGNEWGNE
jgi:hypothetical protein